MRKEFVYSVLVLVLIMACATFFFNTADPRRDLDKPQMNNATFVERFDGGGTIESARLKTAQQEGDTVLQQSVRAAKTFGENIKRDLMGE